ERAFGEVGLDYREYVKIDERFLRPAEVDLLIGDARKAREELGWEPEYTFAEMVKEMVAADLAAAQLEGGRTGQGIERAAQSASRT
ncbi:MAG: GDPmannose 4,6-dehydratase, partial [Acidobacteriota bacterium]|nr:GDPmannose 4,6-dehydratase [Acidobacteriota bacterium]